MLCGDYIDRPVLPGKTVRSSTVCVYTKIPEGLGWISLTCAYLLSRTEVEETSEFVHHPVCLLVLANSSILRDLFHFLWNILWHKKKTHNIKLTATR